MTNQTSLTFTLLPEPKIRRGLRDIWNAHMAHGATFLDFDIPFCPTTADSIPSSIITWDEAIAIHRRHSSSKNNEYYHDAFVCFYIDDYKFDGPKGIWHNCYHALDVLKHFAGVITPDFSTYQDFPEAIKIYATYRMRLFGFWLGREGLAVINNVRWGSPESWNYSFVGIPQNSIVAIGTAGGSPRPLNHREHFESGLTKMVVVLQPHTILVYGSANYVCFEELRQRGINIVSYPSKMAAAYNRRNGHEQE